jgi:hypothetical protein
LLFLWLQATFYGSGNLSQIFTNVFRAAAPFDAADIGARQKGRRQQLVI